MFELITLEVAALEREVLERIRVKMASERDGDAFDDDSDWFYLIEQEL